MAICEWKEIKNITKDDEEKCVGTRWRTRVREETITIILVMDTVTRYIYRRVETAERTVAEVSINFPQYVIEVVNSHCACVNVIIAAVLLQYLQTNSSVLNTQMWFWLRFSIKDHGSVLTFKTVLIDNIFGTGPQKILR